MSESEPDAVYVIKRNGRREEVSFDKVSRRIKNLSEGLNVSHFVIAQKVWSRIYPDVKTTELDELAAKLCASMASDKLDYGTLASRIIISNNHKNTSPSFSETMEQMYNNTDTVGKHSPLITEEMYSFVKENKEKLNSSINYEWDYLYDYFAYKTLERAYLGKVKGKVVERIQQMFMRVSLGIWGTDLKNALRSYRLMGQKMATHATPTLYHAGTLHQQMISCFLLGTDDSIDGIYKTIADCAKISKWAGGIGVHISNIRGTGAYIRGTNGKSNGIIPMLKVYNDTAQYVDQGGGKRKGSFAIYLEPHHPDIQAFLEIRLNQGAESERARDLFSAIWISDHFMNCTRNDKDWYLMDPDETPDLLDLYGDEYTARYEEYVAMGRYVKKVRARDVWDGIVKSITETGTPYIGFKDHVNRKSNQKKIGTIHSSNLCHEIVEYSDSKEYACCCLCSICLPQYVRKDDVKPYFDHKTFIEVCGQMTRNLNEVVDLNYYPVPETRRSNMRHRPLGQGVQGLADVYMMMRYPFASKEARQLNKEIFESMYYGTIKMSADIAKERYEGMKHLNKLYRANVLVCTEEDPYTVINKSDDKEVDALIKKLRPNRWELEMESHFGAYSTFVGSPLHNGEFQFDMWGVKPSDRYDWETLRTQIKEYGVRNSLLIALMPTASTSQIMGNNEAFEPYTSNFYVRSTNAGAFKVLNKHLIRDLVEGGYWNKKVKQSIIEHEGSVQHLDIPDDLKELYKTVWEIPQFEVLQQAADRGAFVCQTQSMNIHFQEPTKKLITSTLFTAHELGLKTGSYYFRSQPKAAAQKFTVGPKARKRTQRKEDVPCESCSG